MQRKLKKQKFAKPKSVNPATKRRSVRLKTKRRGVQARTKRRAARQSESAKGPLSVHMRKTAAAVVSGRMGDPLEAVITELLRLPLQEIIVVLSGTPGSKWQASGLPERIQVLRYDCSISGDEARALGAEHTTAEIVLFMDGSTPVSADRLVSYLTSADQGADAVVCDISSRLGTFSTWSDWAIVQAFVNCTLRRGDLLANSLTVLPYALSRRAIHYLGKDVLAVPPVAHAALIAAGMKVVSGKGSSVPRPQSLQQATGSGWLIDSHLKALRRVMLQSGGSSRMSFPDRLRRREEGGWKRRQGESSFRE